MAYHEQIISLINYIEKNLCNSIFIDDVAKQASMSIPHLYRAFPLVTGCTIGAYIRKRRLSLSAHDLANTDKRIIDIAVEYGYDSQESYIRAFTKMFNVTPGKYRKTRVAIECYPKFDFLQIEEENMSSAKSYTDADRDACLPIIDLLVECAETTRSHGVLSLEDFILRQGNDFLIYIMMMVIDGTDPQLIKGIGETLLAYSNNTVSAELERIIIIEGALSIQAGENPHLIRTKLLTFMGEPFLKKKGLFPGGITIEMYEQRVAALAGKSTLPESAPFDKIIQRLSNRDMRFALKEIEWNKLALALKGCNEESAISLISNISKRLAVMLLDDMEHMGVTKKSAILEAQELIINTIYRLAKSGEIILKAD